MNNVVEQSEGTGVFAKTDPVSGGETDGLGQPAFWLPSVDHKDPMKVLEGEQITSVLQRSWAGRDAGVD